MFKTKICQIKQVKDLLSITQGNEQPNEYL